MPRVRATATGSTAQNTASPMKSAQIPLNDDRQEKAQRLQSRQAAHAKQLDSYKAAASPAKKRKSLGQSQGGPATPSQSQGESQEYGVAGTAITPMNMRKGQNVPILANFEEWMKMATDNKINLNNTWNFALIDYFHDMSLLKEGDGVNFQKASCTLDGCVKIYTSRVDSVASETGKLLSGLTESKSKKGKGGDDSTEGDGEEGEEDETEEGGASKKKSKRAKRSAEATLVNSFEQLRLKKMELEFAVDPLFKKASADFDEGGAKGLLLNHLSIDATGRIVFDSSDDAQKDALDASRRDSMDPEGEASEKQPDAIPEDKPIDIARLGARFFPDLQELETQDICPSLKTFELGSGDASMDLPFLKAPENWRDERPETLTGSADQTAILQDDLPNFGNDDDDIGGAFDMPPDIGFGEGGEAWARGAGVHHTYAANSDEGDEGGEVGTFDANGNSYGVKLHHRPENEQENILNYFDAALQKNWAGPEHWKIARIREASVRAAANGEKKKERKEKEAFEIDFLSPMTQELATQLYTSAEGGKGAGINLPKKDWKARGRNLLPDDKHFSSRDLLRLFLKPKAMIGARRSTARQQVQRQDLQGYEGEVDEAYWASNNHSAAAQAGEGAVQGDYDANFFNDDNLPLPGGGLDDDDEFADAREQFSPGADEVDAAGGSGPEGPGIDGILAGSSQEGANGEAFGANLIAQSRRLRPEYVQYARVAKKVDVRRLKEEMWRGIGFEQPQSVPPTPSTQLQPPNLAKQDETAALHFVDIMNNLQHVYPKQQMADISTSYGFICLLHLANEKGLVIENVEGWEDLVVRRDMGAVVGEGDA